MADIQVLSETPINSYLLKKELEKIRKRDKELDFRMAKTEEYINQIATHKNAEQLFDKISALNIPRLKDNQIHKIIDIMPTIEKDLQVILQGYPIGVSKESMKKIVDAINEFVGKS